MKQLGAISLSLLLLLAVGIESWVTNRGTERCQCKIKSSKIIPLERVTDFQVFPISPFCGQLEYIVTWENPKTQSSVKECLDPALRKIRRYYRNYQDFKNKAGNGRRRPQ